jgi:hypothetical protein
VLRVGFCADAFSADGVIPCPCGLHEDAVEGATGADCVCVCYLERACRVGEEVVEEENHLPTACRRNRRVSRGQAAT